MARIALQHFARFGYSVKGALYLLIGALALQSALGSGGGTVDTKGAVEHVARGPFGITLLVLITLGLFAYAGWRFVQAALDPEGKGSDAKGWVRRMGLAGSGFLYAGVGLYSGRRLVGAHAGGDGGVEDKTALLLRQPFGPWLVGIAAVATLFVGAHHMRRAAKASFEDKLRFDELGPRMRRTVLQVCRFGIGARAAIFLLMGALLARAAFRMDPSEAEGLAGALDELRSWPSGAFVLAGTAAGLVAYGSYCVVNARYRSFAA